jgi:hypothetical protein
MNTFFEFALALYVGIALFYCFVAFSDRRRSKDPKSKPPPPAPEHSTTNSADEQYDAQLAHLGATYGPRGWLLALWCTQFKSGNVHWEPTDSDTLEGIAQLLEGHAHSRVLIEACSETPGSRRDTQELFPVVLAAVRNLVDRGGNHGRIHAHCQPADAPVPLDSTADVWLQVCRIEILFSDTAGRFRPTADALVGNPSCA